MMADKCYQEKMFWTSELVTKLCNLYKKHHELYDPNNKSYKKKSARHYHYSMIANEMGLPLVDVKKKLHTLRTQYTAEKWKILKSIESGGERHIPTIYWYPLLNFLDSTSAEQCFTGALINENYTHDSSTEFETRIKTEVDLLEDLPTPPEPKRYRKLSEEVHTEAATSSSTHQRLSSQPQPPGPSQTPSNFSAFGAYIAEELRDILYESGSPALVRIAKRKIMKAMAEAWDALDSLEEGLLVPNMDDESPE